MKKIIAAVLFAILYFSYGNMQEAEAAGSKWIESGDWLYCVEDGSATIGGYKGTQENVSIPPSLDGYAVKKLQYCIFSQANVSCVTVPYTVEEIETMAFSIGLDAEHHIKIGTIETINVDPGNPTYCSIDGVLFTKDKKTLAAYPQARTAQDYSIPAGVELVDTFAFENNRNIKNVKFPKSVKRIGSYAFSCCSGLKGVKLNKGLLTMDSCIFQDCVSLSSLTIPKTVIYIDFNNPMCPDNFRLSSIRVASGNKYYSSKDGVIFNKNKTILYEYPAGKQDVSYRVPGTVETITSMRDNLYLQEVTLPTSVKTIGSQAFSGSRALARINMKSSVTLIGSQAFYCCAGIREITIPKNVKAIGDDAFFGCTSLAKITVKAKECRFFPNNSVVPGSTVLYGYRGSTAQIYAETYGRTFVNIETNEEIKYVYDAGKLFDLLPLPSQAAYGEPAFPGISYRDRDGIFCGYQPSIIHEYNTSREEYINLKNFAEELVKDCATGRQKIEAVSKWVHENLEYSYGSISGNSIESVYIIFERRYGNCMCYAQLTNYMLYLVGIPSASVIVPGHEMGVAYDGAQWLVVDSTNGYTGTAVPDHYGRVEQIVFSSGQLTFDIRSTEGVCLGAVGYDQNDQKTIKSITIPPFVQGFYKEVFSGLSDSTAIKGTVGTPAEKFCRENFTNYKRSGNMFSVVNVSLKSGKKDSSGIKKGTVFTKNGVKYKVTEKASSGKSGRVSCVGYTGTLKGIVNIPGHVKKSGENFEVTEIGTEAFKNNMRISKVTVPKEVRQIGKSAFAECKKLNSFTAGASITKIGAYAFKGDGKLKTVTVRTGKLTESGVKDSLKGSSVKKIKLAYSAVGKKSYYKKLFKKSNSGKKVKVK